MIIENEKDVIKKLYNNEIFAIKENNDEYKKIAKKIRKIERIILKKSNVEVKKYFENYTEYITQRESIEAEEQFIKGFKLAIQIIIESLK